MAQVQYNFILYYKGEFWYISDDLFDEEGNIRSHSEGGDMFLPQQGWEYRKLRFSCTTVRWIHGPMDPCIFPFIYKEVEHWGCSIEQQQKTEKAHRLMEGQVQIN